MRPSPARFPVVANILLSRVILELMLALYRMWTIEFETLPVLGSVKRPDALHRGSSGNRSRNLSRRFLNLITGRLEIEVSQGGRQFQRSLAVRAKELLRWI